VKGGASIRTTTAETFGFSSLLTAIWNLDAALQATGFAQTQVHLTNKTWSTAQTSIDYKACLKLIL
jgi:hypothetical protein